MDIYDEPRRSGRGHAMSEGTEGQPEPPSPLHFSIANMQSAAPRLRNAQHCKARQAYHIFTESSGQTTKALSSRPLPAADSTPHRPSRQNRIYIDIVTPRATHKVAATPMKGRGGIRAPLADKSAHNTPRIDKSPLDKMIIDLPSDHCSPLGKPISARLKAGKGLAPSPAQRRAPRKVEVVDLDSDGETGQCPRLPTVQKC
jgi:hypothetical protein